MKIAIIGAGMAGLACATRLKGAGHAPVLLDKGRGIGGRIATRRAAPGLQFDHGAQYITAKTDAFRQVLEKAVTAGTLALWDDGSGRDHYVGTPGMTGFAKHLSHGLDVRQSTEITGLRQTSAGWQLSGANIHEDVDIVVSTAPAPQTFDLLGENHVVSRQIANASYDPCLTLMIALSRPVDVPVTTRDLDADLSWIAQDNTKPERPGSPCWVAQAGPAWSSTHLELDLEDIRGRMLELFLKRVGLSSADTVLHAAAHRWRYARVSRPLGKPFAKNDDGSFYAGGDWCIGARVEGAWQSGTAIADDILDTT